MGSPSNEPTPLLVLAILAALGAGVLGWTLIRVVRPLARFYALRSEARRMLRVADDLDPMSSTDVRVTEVQLHLQAIAGDLDTLRRRLRRPVAGFLAWRGYDIARACRALALFGQMLRRSDREKIVLHLAELCGALKLPRR